MKALIQFIERKLSLVILLGTSLFFANNSTGQTVVLTNPASPWTVPAGVTQIKVEVWGGGGGGGGGTGFGGFATGTGGGGGGGAYNVSTLSVTPGHTFTITIGAGGTVGATSAGGNGGTTTVTGVDGTVIAGGGGGGGRGNFGNGTAGAASTGGFNNGGAGAAGSGSGSGGGGGGAGNLTPSAAGNGISAVTITGGNGGPGSPNTTPYIGGKGASGSATSNSGAAGFAPGGGGSGGVSNSTSQSGTVGGAGQVVITYTLCPTISTTAGYNNPVCLGSAINLTATNASGGTSPYTYSWSGPLSYASTSQNPTIANSTTAMAGTYTVTAKDNNGCTGSSNVTVTINPLPVSAVTAQTNISCNGANDGTITVGASGGTGPYTFSVDGTNFFAETSPNTRLFTGLAPNNPYTIKVKDSNQCISK